MQKTWCFITSGTNKMILEVVMREGSVQIKILENEAKGSLQLCFAKSQNQKNVLKILTAETNNSI